MQTETTTIATRDGASVAMSSEKLDDLAGRAGGHLLRPDDDGWAEATTLWNEMVAKEPALVVQPGSAAEVAGVVAFARDHGLLTSVKGGGHNIAGTAIAAGGLTIEMSRMRTVEVEPEAKRAHVGPGCLLKDVDAATQEHGLATTLGFISEVGVAGLTLGGGFGYLARRFGWAADNLEELEIVTSDGRIRIANAIENPDLFWALRGGSGNFGVVTRFTFRLHDLGPTITGGLILWGADRADEVLATYRDLTQTAPRELTAAAVIRLAPPAPFIPTEWHLKPVVGVLVCHSGRNAEQDLAPLRALGNPVFDDIEERPYAEQQSMLNDMDPNGLFQYWKTEYLPALTDEYLATFRDAALAQVSPLSYSVIFHIEGAINERASDDGAVGNRDARFISGFSGVCSPDMPVEPMVAWVREAWEKIRPFSTGGNYVNFQMAEDDMSRTEAAYGKNFERLQQVKAVYDPDNVFRVNRNISPAR